MQKKTTSESKSDHQSVPESLTGEDRAIDPDYFLCEVVTTQKKVKQNMWKGRGKR